MIPRPPSPRVFAVASLLLLAACSTMPEAAFDAAPPLPETAHPAPIGFSHLAWRVPTGSPGGRVGSGFCLVKYAVESREIKSSVERGDIRDAFFDTLRGEGYDLTGSPDLAFDEEIENDAMRTEYRIAGDVVDAQTDACYNAGVGGLLSPLRGGYTGTLYLKIRWHVFDALRRSSVFQVETAGYARRAIPNPDGLGLLVDDAFAMAAHNLGADAQFRDLIVHGVRPAQGSRPNINRPRRYEDTGRIGVPSLPLRHAPFAGDAGRLGRAAVMIEGGAGFGSGFFISRDGYILTAQHVVGDALHVRIVPSGKGGGLIAEVIRTDPARDVALLRLMDPAAYDAHPLPLRRDWPAIGTRVYAIGAPRATWMQDTVTSGIVSAWRKDFHLLGTRQDILQSDVVIQAGNSGGPLLDEDGNVVAITDAGSMNGDFSIGLNYFIPIDEALHALRLDLQ